MGRIDRTMKPLSNGHRRNSLRALSAGLAGVFTGSAGGALLLRAGAASAQNRAGKAAAKEIEWNTLIPKSWNPTQAMRDLKLDEIRSDADPRAIEAMAKLRKLFDEAPVEPSLSGMNIKILGFLVPLDMTPQAIGEFLLVPFFGACIHTPPPPANQIIHVIPKEPMKGMRAMEQVWVEGVLETVSNKTSMGQAGYRVKNPTTTVYKRS